MQEVTESFEFHPLSGLEHVYWSPPIVMQLQRIRFEHKARINLVLVGNLVVAALSIYSNDKNVTPIPYNGVMDIDILAPLVIITPVYKVTFHYFELADKTVERTTIYFDGVTSP